MKDQRVVALAKANASHGERLEDLLAKMRFVSEAAGAQLEREAASAESDKTPKWSGPNLFDTATHATERFLDDLEKWLHRAQHSPKPPDDQQQAYRDHVLKQHEGKHYEDAAMIEKVSVTYIRQVRIEAGRNPLDGKVKNAPGKP